MNKQAKQAFDRMKKDPHQLELQEIFLIVDGLKEDLEKIIIDCDEEEEK
jgi:hypothetical protein